MAAASDDQAAVDPSASSDDERLILTEDQRVLEPAPLTAREARARKIVSNEPFLQTPALSLRAKIAELEQAVDRTFDLYDDVPRSQSGLREEPAAYSPKRPEWLRSRHRARAVQRFQSSTAVAYHDPSGAPAEFSDTLASILPGEGISDAWEVAVSSGGSGSDGPGDAPTQGDTTRGESDASGATLRLVTPLPVEASSGTDARDSGPGDPAPQADQDAKEPTRITQGVTSPPPVKTSAMPTIPPADPEVAGELSEEAWLTAGANAQSAAFPPNEEDEDDLGPDDPLEDAVRAIASAVANKVTLADAAQVPEAPQPSEPPAVSKLPVAPPAQADSQTPPAQPEAAGEDNPNAGLLVQVGAIDAAALRSLVADVVREELQGHLGEAVTRNIRSLVRREINRALASHDLK